LDVECCRRDSREGAGVIGVAIEGRELVLIWGVGVSAGGESKGITHKQQATHTQHILCVCGEGLGLGLVRSPGYLN